MAVLNLEEEASLKELVSEYEAGRSVEGFIKHRLYTELSHESLSSPSSSGGVTVCGAPMAAHFGDDEDNTGSPTQKAESAIGRETGRIEQLRGTDPANIRCIDTETTGLEPGKDEILQVSVVNGNGDVLFDSLVKPTHRKRWPKAAEVNGITPDMVG